MDGEISRFGSRFGPFVEAVKAGRVPGVADAVVLNLPASAYPWTDSGITLEAGEWFSWFAEGRIGGIASEGGPALPLAGPCFYLWGRHGGASPVFKGTKDTTTRQALHAGPLELAICIGQWSTPAGDIATPAELYALIPGSLDVLVVKWASQPDAALSSLVGAGLGDDPLVTAEAARLADPVEPPPGWTYLWFLGEGEIYRAAQVDGRPAIEVDCTGEVGILRTPVDVPLGPDTTLAWSWRVDALPTDQAEDTIPTHDYVSVAVEFDDGLDLTWYWSAALAPHSHYHCPLPYWCDVETHYVVRSGTDGLGQWHAEARVIAPDRDAAIGGPAPARIVRVWLIANSLFGGRNARAAFADIRLTSGGREYRVL